MNRPVILSKHVEGNIYNHPHFFFINKGRNLGKPITFPQSDSYVCITRKVDFEYLYRTCYYLWHCNGFKEVSEIYLFTPIPLKELNNIIKSFQAGLHFTPEECERFLLKIRRAERMERMFNLNNSLAEDGRELVRNCFVRGDY